VQHTESVSFFESEQHCFTIVLHHRSHQSQTALASTEQSTLMTTGSITATFAHDLSPTLSSSQLYTASQTAAFSNQRVTYQSRTPLQTVSDGSQHQHPTQTVTGSVMSSRTQAATSRTTAGVICPSGALTENGSTACVSLLSQRASPYGSVDELSLSVVAGLAAILAFMVFLCAMFVVVLWRLRLRKNNLSLSTLLSHPDTNALVLSAPATPPSPASWTTHPKQLLTSQTLMVEPAQTQMQTTEVGPDRYHANGNTMIAAPLHDPDAAVRSIDGCDQERGSASGVNPVTRNGSALLHAREIAREMSLPMLSHIPLRQNETGSWLPSQLPLYEPLVDSYSKGSSPPRTGSASLGSRGARLLSSPTPLRMSAAVLPGLISSNSAALDGYDSSEGTSQHRFKLPYSTNAAEVVAAEAGDNCLVGEEASRSCPA